ncbi:TPA: HNH endonuclease [Citrobacter farmeri]
MNELPDRLPRNYIINAIRAYDDGFPHLFKEARRYEVEFEGRRYPSKAIAGIAATLMTGKTFTPNDFSGGIKSKCVRLLIEQGFHIVQEKKGNAPVSDTLFPDELAPQIDYVEGAAMHVVVNRYERDRNARQKALEHHGCQCKVCGVDMSKIYGEIGNGFIHVHHLVPLSAIKENYHLDPINDLIPVCPNCHAMLHRQNPPLTPEELKQRMG